MGTRCRARLHRLRADAGDRGASAVEYGLMVAAIAAVIVGIVFGLGGIVSHVFSNTCSAVGTQAQQNTRECEVPGGNP